MSILDFLDVPYASEWEAFGDQWCGPERYKHCEKTLIAEYKKYEGGDGQNVKVFCFAAPARFYELEVEPGVNSIKKPQKGYRVSTGSGQADLAAKIASAIADGMLGFDQLNDD